MKNARVFDLFFSRMTPLIKLGQKKSLEPTDFPELPIELDPRSIVMDENIIRWDSASGLLSSLFRASARHWLPAFFLIALAALFNLCSPYLVHEFVARLEVGPEAARAWQTWFFAVLVGLIGMCSGLSMQHYYYRILRLYQIYTNLLNRKLFDHSLRLSKESREKIAIGDIVNHMSSDSDSVANLGSICGDLVYNFILLIGVALMMAHFLGLSSIVAWVLLLSLVPLTKKIGADFSRLDESLMKKRDQRVTLMSQILSAIRVVKFFVWEKSVKAEVGLVREQELQARKKLAFAELLATMSYVAVSTFVLFAVLLVHSMRGFELTASLVFTCVSLFNLLEDPFASLSRLISAFANARVGAKRISFFLEQPQVLNAEASDEFKNQSPDITFSNCDLKFEDSEVPALKNLNFKIYSGEMIAVVGPVGAGKSTLLLALMRELRLSRGELAIPKLKTAYVSQEAYLINGTFRDNLLLGSNKSDAEIHRALLRSCLLEDIKNWDAGLETEIGEKGVNLSGGQKQRLSLARADLQQADLFLLDDPLSAVDFATENILVQELLIKAWQGKTRIVVTHRLDSLAEFDRILFLESGEVVGFDSHENLLNHNHRYQEFLSEQKSFSQVESQHVAHSEQGTDSAIAATPTAVGAGSNARLTQEEDREVGAVRGSIYFDYLKSLGGRAGTSRIFIWFGLGLAASASTALPLLQKFWLGFVSNIQNQVTSVPQPWLDWGLQSWVLLPVKSVYVYGFFGLLTLIGILLADLFWLERGLAAGRDMHNAMLDSVLKAPVRFFDSTPVGRVLQRFSRDLEAIDIQLQWTFEHSMKCFAQVLITLVLIVSSLPIILFAIIPILFVYWRYQMIYRQAAREAKRLDSVSRSPRYAHFKETLQGLLVIRAFDRTKWFMDTFYRHLAYNQQMFYGHYMINRWFSSRIPVIGALVATCTSLAIVHSVSRGLMSPGVAGLLTIYSLNFWGVLNWGVRIWADVEAKMTSVERVRFMSNLEQEKIVSKNISDLSGWPLNGEIEFRGVQARYAPGLPLVLKGVSFKIEAKSRVGLIGRTGSGKSTIFQTLYRFLEIENGEIYIDGIDIASIPLDRLRKVLAVIPQDPSLFLGTLRSNLDRFQEFSDDELWQVLARTQLANWVKEKKEGLLLPILESGQNLSQGQRQLMCLARALLLKAKILIMDEATASVDVQTDAIIQRLIREECKDMTIVMIAHRLGTVRDSDQIIELSHGEIKRVLRPQVKSQVTTLH